MRRSFLPFIALALLVPSLSSAQETALTPIADRSQIVALLASYAGEWTGRGQTRSDFDDELEAAACRLETVFDAATETLTNTGACANSVRAIDIIGELTIAEDGGLTGGYFGGFDAAQLLESGGVAYEEGFVVNARYQVEIRREVREIDVEVRVGAPILRDDGRTAFSMVVLVLDQDTSEYVEFSVMIFTLNI